MALYELERKTHFIEQSIFQAKKKGAEAPFFLRRDRHEAVFLDQKLTRVLMP